jgi:hypothetical protein
VVPPATTTDITAASWKPNAASRKAPGRLSSFPARFCGEVCFAETASTVVKVSCFGARGYVELATRCRVSLHCKPLLKALPAFRVVDSSKYG